MWGQAGATVTQKDGGKDSDSVLSTVNAVALLILHKALQGRLKLLS